MFSTIFSSLSSILMDDTLYAARALKSLEIGMFQQKPHLRVQPMGSSFSIQTPQNSSAQNQGLKKSRIIIWY